MRHVAVRRIAATPPPLAAVSVTSVPEYRQRRPTPSEVNLSCRKPVGSTPLPRRLKKETAPANCCQL